MEKEYSKKLKSDLNKKYNERTLRRYRQFYNFVVNLKWSALPTKLSWSHITELMVLSDKDEIEYYITIVNEKNIGYRKLNELIKEKDYSRVDNKTKTKIKENKQLEINDLIKSPIIIKNNKYEIISEKILQKLILENINDFLTELGIGFCYIGNEYKIKLGNTYNYIDLILYNYKYKCFIVVELKVTELKKEHIGQIEIYMNYVDKNIKGIDDNKTVGIIICKRNNEYVIDYCSDNRIIFREYKIK